MKQMTALTIQFFEKKGAYWIRVIIHSKDGEETVMETECDTNTIRFNFTGEPEKSDFN